ncbi:hypothetical protein TNCV_3084851 [Trichonephila clavipes]|nr:hypothetical protein TNCV_3084851 [Trichonephila clavipes]
MLRRCIAARPRPPATVRDLEIALLQEWNSIPQIAFVMGKGEMGDVRSDSENEGSDMHSKLSKEQRRGPQPLQDMFPVTSN